MSTPFYKLSPGGIDTVGLGLRSPAGLLFPITSGVEADLDTTSQAGALHLTAEGPLVLIAGVPTALAIVGEEIAGDFLVIDSGTLKFGTAGTDLVFTANGTDVVVTGTGDLNFVDSLDVSWGTGKDLTIVHNGTNTLVTSATGNLIIDSTGATSHTYMDLGTDTSATSWAVRNNSGTALFEVTADGVAASTSRLTTTDAVASGTAKVVGGRLSNSVADSSAIAQAAAGYSSFDVTASIPANTLKAGSILKIRAVVRISVALNGGAVASGKLRLGGTDLVTSAASTAGAANTRLVLEATLTARAAPGAAAAIAGVAQAVWSDTVAVITTGAPAGVPTFATNGALVVDAQVSTDLAGDASGRLVLEQLYVEVI